MLIAPAFAQEGPAAGGGDIFMSLLPILLIFVVFYFLLIRPQQKRAKEHRNMVANLRRGDRVVTGGGIVGQVSKVLSDTEVQLEIAEGVRIKVVRSTITSVLDKTQPAAPAPAPKGRKAEPEKSEQPADDEEQKS